MNPSKQKILHLMWTRKSRTPHTRTPNLWKQPPGLVACLEKFRVSSALAFFVFGSSFSCGRQGATEKVCRVCSEALSEAQDCKTHDLRDIERGDSSHSLSSEPVWLEAQWLGSLAAYGFSEFVLQELPLHLKG